MANDPLTSIAAMISTIEPGFRIIDATLLKDLLNQAGLTVLAASMDGGWRMVDATVLKQLATQIGAPINAAKYDMPYYRLTDGTVWKATSQMAAGQITPAIDPAPIWSMRIRYGEAHNEGKAEPQIEPVRPPREGDGEGGERPRELSNSQSESREERPRSRRSARFFHREGEGESGC